MPTDTGPRLHCFDGRSEGASGAALEKAADNSVSDSGLGSMPARAKLLTGKCRR